MTPAALGGLWPQLSLTDVISFPLTARAGQLTIHRAPSSVRIATVETLFP
jgi:aspartyl-tRNA synthetase